MLNIGKGHKTAVINSIGTSKIENSKTESTNVPQNIKETLNVPQKTSRSSTVGKFFIQHQYLNLVLFFVFVGIFSVIILQTLINSPKFLPIDYNTQTIIFSRIFILLFILSYLLFTWIYIILTICAFFKYKRTLYLIKKIIIILYSVVVTVLSYFVWLLVIYNVIKYFVAVGIIALCLVVISFICYNNKHE